MVTDKLYLVKTKAPRPCMSGKTNYSEFYVVAEDSAKAYQQVRDYLDKYGLCFTTDREMESVTLLAEHSQYPYCQHMLFLPGRDVSEEKA